MEQTQTSTEIEQISAAVSLELEKQAADKLLKFQQEQYVDFVALGGIYTNEDGSFDMSETVKTKTMTVTEFSLRIGVPRRTLYGWQNRIPNFWGRVNDRRKTLFSQQRISKVWNGIYLKAASGNPQAAALFFANFDDNFHMPTEKVEHGVTDSLADVLNIARNRKLQHQDAIDGEIVDDTEEV
jgi:hypothetical protein